MLIILIGASATGKTVQQKKILQKEKDFERIITYTTRPMREGEKDGVHYHFVDDETFSKMKEEGRFFETVDRQNKENNQNVVYHYGSPIVDAENKNYCIVLDRDGADKYVKQFGISNCFIVELELDEQIRKSRTKNRGTFSEEAWNERKMRDKEQFEREDSISNFKLNTYGMSVKSVTSAILQAFKSYKQNLKGDYRRVIIKQELRNTNYWEQPEVVYIPEFIIL